MAGSSARFSSVFHHSAVQPSIFLRHARSGFLFKQRQQRAQGLGAVADKIDFHRIPQAQHVGLDIDLDAARMAFLRQEFRVRKARADHQQRVAFHHQVVAGLRAEQTDRARHPGEVVGQHSLAEQRLRDACAELVSHGDDFIGRIQRAGADQDRHFLALVQHLGSAPQVGVIRDDFRGAEADAGMQRAVLARGGFIVQFLQVVRQDDRGDRALRQRRANGAIDKMAHLGRHTRLLHERAGDVLEHRHQIEFLLIVAAEGGPRLLSGDRKHRHVVHACVI